MGAAASSTRRTTGTGAGAFSAPRPPAGNGDRRQQEGPPLALQRPHPHNLPGIVDVPRFYQHPAALRADEPVQVHHHLAAPEEGTRGTEAAPRATPRCPGAAHHLPALVEGQRLAVETAEGAEVLHHPLAVEEGVLRPLTGRGPADHF